MSLTSSDRAVSILRLISMRNVFIQTKPYYKSTKRAKSLLLYTIIWKMFHPSKKEFIIYCKFSYADKKWNSKFLTLRAGGDDWLPSDDPCNRILATIKLYN